jgi:hypothetical protein
MPATILSWTWLCSRVLTRNGPPRSREATLMGFPAPTTHQATGSDQHRDCRSRLCNALRLSQPLDALLHPLPLRPCFGPVAPMGFRPSEVSPPRLSGAPLGDPAPPDVVVGASVTGRCPSPLRSLQSLRHPVSFRGRSTAVRSNTYRELAFRGSNLTGSPLFLPVGVTPPAGADPLLGFQPSKVLAFVATP